MMSRFVLIVFGFVFAYLFLVQEATCQEAGVLLDQAKKVLRSNPDSALYYGDKALAIAKLPDSILLELHLTRAEAYRLKGTLEGFEKSLAAAKELNLNVK